MSGLLTKAGIVVGVASRSESWLTPIAWGISIATQTFPINTNTAWLQVMGEEVGDARNQIVEEALKLHADKIMFFDDDTVPPQNAITQLTYVLNQKGISVGGKVAVVGGIYCSKTDLPEPLVFMESGQGAYWNWKAGEVFKCWAIGCGCMLVDTEIFKHIEPPYFKTTYQEGKIGTEDLYFCDKVNKAGFEVMAHGGVLPSHWDVEKKLIYTLPKNSFPMQSK